jgi:hypothetical protein
MSTTITVDVDVPDNPPVTMSLSALTVGCGESSVEVVRNPANPAAYILEVGLEPASTSYASSDDAIAAAVTIVTEIERLRLLRAAAAAALDAVVH